MRLLLKPAFPFVCSLIGYEVVHNKNPNTADYYGDVPTDISLVFPILEQDSFKIWGCVKKNIMPIYIRTRDSRMQDVSGMCKI